MSPAFLRAVDLVLAHEGGYTADPRDRGNWTSGVVGQGELRGTNFGIAAHAYPTEDIRRLTPQRARELYHRDYWQRVRGDELPPAVAVVVFDAAVNSGVGRAARWLQGAVGVAVDGQIGPRTVAAARAQDAQQVAVAVTQARLLFLTALATFPTFGRGWTRRTLETLVAGVTL
jgi:lysozyme family protein